MISISEFQKLVHLSDEALLWLIKNKRLPCSVSADGSLAVNTSDVEIKALVQAVASLRSEVISELDHSFIEKCARLVSRHLEGIADEAAHSVLLDHAHDSHEQDSFQDRHSPQERSKRVDMNGSAHGRSK